MLSLFPQFLDWGWYVPFVFRIFLALYTLRVGVSFIRQQNKSTADSGATWGILGTLVAALGLLFFFGVYIQIAAVVGFSLAVLAGVLSKTYPSIVPESKAFYLLIGIVSLSLLFLGAGPYAFDLPL